MWSALWKMKVPSSKITVFGWRACHDILPTRVNLAKCKIISDNVSHYCKCVPENAVHTIWECGAAQDVWAGSLTVLQKVSTNQFDFM